MTEPTNPTPHPLIEYRITFGPEHAGQNISADPADAWLSMPSGWLSVLAPDELTARVAVINRIGRRWSGITAIHWSLRLVTPNYWTSTFPLGELARWECPVVDYVLIPRNG
jgi:hypothetical protein